MGREILVRDRKGNTRGVWLLGGMASAIILFALALSREPSSAPPSPAANLIAVLLVGSFAGLFLLFGRSLPLDSRRFTSESVIALARWLAVRLQVPLDIDDDFPAAH